MHVPRPQGTPFQIAELVEHKQRVIAHTSEMAVVGGAFLGAMSFTDAAIHVEHDSGLRLALVHPVDLGTGETGQSGEVGFAA